MKTVNFCGTSVDAITYQEMFDLIDEWIKDKEGRSHHIACTNAYNVALSLRNEEIKRIYNSADISGADGMPFVRWIRNVNHLKCDRLDAPSIVLQLAERAKTTNYTFYLYGGAPEVCIKMKEFLENKFPHIRIIGHYSPPFRALTKEEDDAIVAQINNLKPDIICVGLGTPKQDYWIDSHLYSIKGSVLIAAGATFDFFGGRVKFAPEFIRQSGFEWLYRLLGKDFKRLWRRYTIWNGIFLGNFFMQVTRLKRFENNKLVRS